MKVRISGNSIRFRLKQSELQRFAEEGKLSEVTEFGVEPEDTLTFTLSVTESHRFKLKNTPNTVTVEVPQTLALKWTQTALVGLEESLHTGKGRIIKILMEKDFRCLDGSDEENEDSFPNPNINC